MIREKQPRSEMIIDLSGPDGNAFVLLGYARSFSNQLGNSKEETESIVTEMMSGDYENLINVFDREFGTFVILER